MDEDNKPVMEHVVNDGDWWVDLGSCNLVLSYELPPATCLRISYASTVIDSHDIVTS